MVQDSEVGDGTTSVTVLAAELLREAERLVQMRLHPQTIISGWRKACDVAKEALDKAAVASKYISFFSPKLTLLSRSNKS